MQIGHKSFNVVVVFDDTDTFVRIFTDDVGWGEVPVAEGRARRMKGDTRDEALGVALATGRAFQQLADQELEYADGVLNPPKPEPEPEHTPSLSLDVNAFVRAIRRLRRA